MDIRCARCFRFISFPKVDERLNVCHIAYIEMKVVTVILCSDCIAEVDARDHRHDALVSPAIAQNIAAAVAPKPKKAKG